MEHSLLMLLIMNCFIHDNILPAYVCLCARICVRAIQQKRNGSGSENNSERRHMVWQTDEHFRDCRWWRIISGRARDMNRIFGNLFPVNPGYYYALADIKPERMRGMKFSECVRAMRYEIGCDWAQIIWQRVRMQLKPIYYDYHMTSIIRNGIMPFTLHQVCVAHKTIGYWSRVRETASGRQNSRVHGFEQMFSMWLNVVERS